MAHANIARTRLPDRLLPLLLALTLIALMAPTTTSHAAAPDGTRSIDTPYSFADLQARL